MEGDDLLLASGRVGRDHAEVGAEIAAVADGNRHDVCLPARDGEYPASSAWRISISLAGIVVRGS